MSNVVECFLDIKEGCYYVLAAVEAFYNGLRETKMVVVVDLDFLKPDWYLLKKPFRFNVFSKTFFDDPFKQFHYRTISRLLGRQLAICEGGWSSLLIIQRTATFWTYWIKLSFNDKVKARANYVYKYVTIALLRISL